MRCRKRQINVAGVMLAQWLSPVLYRRSPPTPPHRLLQAVAVSGAATMIVGFSACFSGGQLASTGDAGDEQGGSSSSGYSGSNGGTGSTSGSGGNGGTGSSGGQMLLDAAGDAIETSPSDSAADLADESANAPTPEGGSE